MGRGLGQGLGREAGGALGRGVGVGHRERGELEREPGSAGGVARGMHGSPVRLGEVAHEREPEARAGHRARAGRAIEAVEHARQVLVGDAGAVVAHLEAALPHLDLDRAARRTPLAGVVEQVRDRAVQPRGSCAHDAGLGVHDIAATRRSRTRALDGGRDAEVEAHVLELVLLDSGL